ncbi:hypothetical protein N8Q21_24630 [Enterobacter hormaechei subsp. xiangfangensis]|uniref:hypothetical protein n=1 Tax=Enterobacter sp. HPCN14 TaxID=2202832 RepID=UPI000D6EF5E7|nr:hypothetical protein [Enterobacter sp. HPCN14]MCU2364352.1 hypothetical protein [Enterobacter hormaechei subsp. xiangfangensis]HDS3786164.1 hypothetical protein [Enterobacter ludwigii]MCU2754882.1 hypothetical protein [Enterobacter hormaechei subsp. xiangfangensis]MCU2998996.1 hypothetical protein [Enterobacter hormaechei subsp. xiangfangensis]PWS08539.1 hypothetical protein DKX24_05350 [Enterobacter sp. HPCN14]
MSLEQRIESFEARIKQLEGVSTHLHIRSEFTMYIISAMIGAGVVNRDGVKELIRNADVSAFNAPAIAEKEKEIMLKLVDKVAVLK